MRVPGIGRKTAERLVIELRDRLDNIGDSGTNLLGAGLTPQQDAISALVALGYRATEASRVVRSVDTDGDSAVESLIREALKALSGDTK